MISHSLAQRHLAVLVVFLLCSSCTSPVTTKDAITLAFEQQRSNIAVEGEGIVVRTLSDDTSGVPHQRFIVRIASGSTVLVSHNTNVAERIDDLKTGDQVSFAGEYIWNPQGGLLHWTHRDPAGRQPPGWIRHKGKTYQ
ncbi:MAG: DUF3465 domain-containing protein [Blastocatellia bacterium]|nr:DUF3465 domain-containing protein [Blastocatellia bacterium]